MCYVQKHMSSLITPHQGRSSTAAAAEAEAKGWVGCCRLLLKADDSRVDVGDSFNIIAKSSENKPGLIQPAFRIQRCASQQIMAMTEV